ncbi:adenylosuccinate lyase [Ureaplasma ceti]|uniref:Adenylosuccinate lyase n=1 Tax=Ureaplasma ceti TaxID=3119530 RepID=A0ABP9U5L4_9BACT
MIDRYSIKEVEQIWSEQQKFDNWLLIEKYVCEALNHLQVISDEDMATINAKIGVNYNRIYELEAIYKHDVIAFTRTVTEVMNDKTARWIHYGLTSTDLVDTSNGMNFYKVNELILQELQPLKSTLKQLAQSYKQVRIMGRTHGVHAQIQSLGLKFLNFLAMIERWEEHFKLLRKDVEVVKLSGAIGNYAFQDPRIEEYVAQKLGLQVAYFSTQVVSRDRFSLYFSCLANFGLVMNQLATEIRHLHRTEVSEVCEGFSNNQKGSSAMPHKKNPITCENICGMSRLLTSLCHTTWENVNLWHERDISHSSNERIIFCDATSLVIYLIRKMNQVLNNLTINLDQINKNINLSNSKNLSQAVMLFLIRYTTLSREEIYDSLQKYAMHADNFLEAVKHDPLFEPVLTQRWTEFLDFINELKYIDVIYSRLIDDETTV